MLNRLLPSRIALCGVACLLAVLAGLFPVPTALATDLPPGVVRYIKEKDNGAKIRFDGLILFSNGELYLPVIPQEIANPQATQAPPVVDLQTVIAKDPANVAYPDILEFDNHWFLLRLIPTTTGKLTMPRRTVYPLALRQGLLPQDLLIPSQLSIPSELRVLLGSLPYTAPVADDTLAPADTLLAVQPDKPLQRPADPLVLYAADMNRHRLVGVDPNSGRALSDVALNCVPKALSLSANGDKLYAACLTTNEVVVIDTVANLVATRISLPAKPFDATLLPAFDRLAVSNRFKNSLSVIDTKRQLKLADIALPGSPGAVASRFEQSVVFVADASLPVVYEVELASGQVLRVINEKKKVKLLRDITDLYVQESPGGLGRLWLLSRTSGKVQVIDLLTQQILMEQTLGGKPSHFVAAPSPSNRLYVVCADSNRIEQIDRDAMTVLEPIALPAGSFPTSLTLDGQGRFAYVSTAADEQLLVVDLASGQVTKTYPYQLRAIDLVLFDQTSAKAQREALDELAAKKKAEPVEEVPKKKPRKLKLKNMKWDDFKVEPQEDGVKIKIKEPIEPEATDSPSDASAPNEPVSESSADQTPSQTEPGPRKGGWPFGRRGPR
jgi:DNA-binding beta-propeller fold protein YncE